MNFGIQCLRLDTISMMLLVIITMHKYAKRELATQRKKLLRFTDFKKLCPDAVPPYLLMVSTISKSIK